MARRNANPILALGLAVMTGACSVFGGKAAEEVPYSLETSEGDFEIRSYGSVVVARTVAQGSYDGTTNEAFRLLFQYISGANQAAQKIDMTAPVLRQDAGTEIAMTAPVFRSQSGDGWEMAFALPEGFTLDNTPQPTDPRVEIAEIPPRRVAVKRFSGFADLEKVESQSAALLAWLSARGLTPTGPISYAGYNPPFTLPPLRRHEVIVPIE